MLAPALRKWSIDAELREEEVALWGLVNRDEALATARASHDGEARHELLLSEELVERYLTSLTPPERDIVDELGTVLGHGADETADHEVLRENDPRENTPAQSNEASPASNPMGESERLARASSGQATVFCEGFPALSVDLGALDKDLVVTVKEVWNALDETCCVEFQIESQTGVDWGRTSTAFLASALAGSAAPVVRQAIAAEMVRRDERMIIRRAIFHDVGAIDAVASVTTAENLPEGLARLPFSLRPDPNLLQHWFEVTAPCFERVSPAVWDSSVRLLCRRQPRKVARTWGEGLGRQWLLDLLRRCAEGLDDDEARVAVLALERLLNSVEWLTSDERHTIEGVAAALAKVPNIGEMDPEVRLVLSDALALGAAVERSLITIRHAVRLREFPEPELGIERTVASRRLLAVRAFGRRHWGWRPSAFSIRDDDEASQVSGQGELHCCG